MYYHTKDFIEEEIWDCLDSGIQSDSELEHKFGVPLSTTIKELVEKVKKEYEAHVTKALETLSKESKSLKTPKETKDVFAGMTPISNAKKEDDTAKPAKKQSITTIHKANNKLSDAYFKDFIDLVKLNQTETYKYMLKFLTENGYKPKHNYKYIFAKGDLPIMLTAHLDTVYAQPIINFNDNNGVITSPQGIGADDRAGIFIIKKLIEKGYRPFVLLCTDEEIGSVGAREFVKDTSVYKLCEPVKYILELDRRGTNDAVYYDCDNKDFSEYIEHVTGYKEASGSFSDISVIAPALGIAAVNLSVGYENEHSGPTESFNLKACKNTIQAVEKLIKDEKNASKFVYIERVYTTAHRGYAYDREFWEYGGYDAFADDGYDYCGRFDPMINTKEEGNTGSKEYEIVYRTDGYGSIDFVIIQAVSELEAIGRFLTHFSTLTSQDIVDIQPG